MTDRNGNHSNNWEKDRPYPKFHNGWFSSPMEIFKPFYDNRADYNTNAKSYYDYLARLNEYFHWLEMATNMLLSRNIQVNDTKSVDMTKIHDWKRQIELFEQGLDYTTENIIELQADVKLSKTIKSMSLDNVSNPIELQNSITIENDGLYSPDYFDALQAIDDLITNILDEIQKIKNRLDTIEQDIKDINNLIDEIQKDIENINKALTEINQTLEQHDNRITQLENMLNKIITNLYNSGAITTNNQNFEFVTGRNIATGNINVFTNTQDGSTFIRTNNGKTENDVVIGEG